VNSVVNHKTDGEEAMEVDDNDNEDEERKTAVRLCKTGQYDNTVLYHVEMLLCLQYNYDLSACKYSFIV